MSIIEKVEAAIAKSQSAPVTPSGALAKAERLADIYADIKPVPFIVPLERFSGLPFENRLSKNAC